MSEAKTKLPTERGFTASAGYAAKRRKYKTCKCGNLIVLGAIFDDTECACCFMRRTGQWKDPYPKRQKAQKPHNEKAHPTAAGGTGGAQK